MDVIEIVAELRAGNFMNGVGPTAGRVVQLLGDSRFTIEVDHSVKGVELPLGAYSTVDQAKYVIIDFWRKCEEALEEMPCPSWDQVPRTFE
ncbi:MAG TPA: hypothetical protein DCP84_06650 [Pseudomonas sp.]|nr:hypothetical protein [Pseudomonas sp.]